jgi:hypothetical protein
MGRCLSSVENRDGVLVDVLACAPSFALAADQLGSAFAQPILGFALNLRLYETYFLVAALVFARSDAKFASQVHFADCNEDRNRERTECDPASRVQVSLSGVWAPNGHPECFAAGATKPPLSRSFIQSGRPDLNRGPLVPQLLRGLGMVWRRVAGSGLAMRVSGAGNVRTPLSATPRFADVWAGFGRRRLHTVRLSREPQIAVSDNRRARPNEDDRVHGPRLGRI